MQDNIALNRRREWENDDSDEKVKELSERLDYELGIIAKTGFNDYFLIVADFMR